MQSQLSQDWGHQMACCRECVPPLEWPTALEEAGVGSRGCRPQALASFGGAPPGDWPGDAEGGKENEKGGIYGELFLKVQSGRVFGVI